MPYVFGSFELAMTHRVASIGLGALLAIAGCGTGPGDPSAEFVVAVGSETFVLRTTHPETMALFRDALAGRRSGFPIGPLRRGDGGFNAPWSWHLDPAATRFTASTSSSGDWLLVT